MHRHSFGCSHRRNWRRLGSARFRGKRLGRTRGLWGVSGRSFSGRTARSAPASALATAAGRTTSGFARRRHDGRFRFLSRVQMSGVQLKVRLRLGFGFRARRFDCGRLRLFAKITFEILRLQGFGRGGFFFRASLATLLAPLEPVAHPFAHIALLAHRRVRRQSEPHGGRDTRARIGPSVDRVIGSSKVKGIRTLTIGSTDHQMTRLITIAHRVNP
jgi:hypothetical protein